MNKQFMIAYKAGWRNQHKKDKRLVRETPDMTFPEARRMLKKILKEHKEGWKDPIRFVIVNKNHPWLKN